MAPAPDLVRREFAPPGPDQVWAADITQLRTAEGWLYLAGVIDLHSRRVVGWTMGASPDTDLVIDALLMAFERRRPDRRVVHHSDRGCTHTSLAFSQRLADLELAQSFGSTGDCFDNAVTRRSGCARRSNTRSSTTPLSPWRRDSRIPCLRKWGKTTYGLTGFQYRVMLGSFHGEYASIEGPRRWARYARKAHYAGRF